MSEKCCSCNCIHNLWLIDWLIDFYKWHKSNLIYYFSVKYQLYHFYHFLVKQLVKNTPHIKFKNGAYEKKHNTIQDTLHTVLYKWKVTFWEVLRTIMCSGHFKTDVIHLKCGCKNMLKYVNVLLNVRQTLRSNTHTTLLFSMPEKDLVCPSK